jgi:hypothetical protein
MIYNPIMIGERYANNNRIPSHTLSPAVSISRDGTERNTARAPINKLIINLTGNIKFFETNDKIKYAIAVTTI